MGYESTLNLQMAEIMAQDLDRQSYPDLNDPVQRAKYKEEQAKEIRAKYKEEQAKEIRAKYKEEQAKEITPQTGKSGKISPCT